MRRLVLLRHGQTDWNASHRVQGQSDSALDATGLAQAVAVAPLIAALEPSALWASDLSRARRTAQIVGEACGLTPKSDVRFREYWLGAVEGLTHEEFAAWDPEDFARFRAGDWGAVQGIEPLEDVARRFREGLSDLLAHLGPDEVGVVVAHGAAIRTGLVGWLGWPATQARDLRALANCGWATLEEREDGAWALGTYNRTV